jgi:hypothetical protein
MAVCDECGSSDLARVVVAGIEAIECGLCGALQGDDPSAMRARLVREARDLGIAPGIYPLLRVLGRVSGLRVVASDGGDPEARRWPFVHLAPDGETALAALDNLLKSLALSRHVHAVHWVVEVEHASRLVFVLKPRFHRDPERIGRELVEGACADLERIRAHLERDMRLSWWRR